MPKSQENAFPASFELKSEEIKSDSDITPSPSKSFMLAISEHKRKNTASSLAEYQRSIKNLKISKNHSPQKSRSLLLSSSDDDEEDFSLKKQKTIGPDKK